METSHPRFLISDSIRQTVEYARSGQKENAFNFASLVVWRVEQHKAWLTDAESAFIDNVLATTVRRRRRKS